MNRPKLLLQRKLRTGNPRSLIAVGFVVVVALSAVAIWRFHADSTTKGSTAGSGIGLRPGLQPEQRLTAHFDETDIRKCLLMYMELTGRRLWPTTNSLASELDEATGGRLSRWKLVTANPQPDSGISFHADGALSAAEAKAMVEAALTRANVQLLPFGKKHFRVRTTAPVKRAQKI
jgi:hypothetical protein